MKKLLVLATLLLSLSGCSMSGEYPFGANYDEKEYPDICAIFITDDTVVDYTELDYLHGFVVTDMDYYDSAPGVQFTIAETGQRVYVDKDNVIFYSCKA